jgi:prolyl oligopeptidase PreP (S9A serine peptidase family)
LGWAGQRNEPTLSGLCADGFDFWRDAQHPRGVWRRTTLEQTYEFGHRMLNNKRSQLGLSQ